MSEIHATTVKFEKIANEIEQRVQNGIYVRSQKLPSEYDLAKEFSVSRLTVRKAIDELIQRNILYKLKNRGTYVMLPQKMQSGRSGLKGFTEAAKEYGKTSQTEVISFHKMGKVPLNIQEALKATTNDSIYELVRRRNLDGEPMTVEKIYLAQSSIEGLEAKDFEGSLFKLLEEKKAIAYSHQEIEAVLVTDELAKLLKVSIGSPLLMVHSVTYTKDGLPILYDESYYRADKYTFKNTLLRN